jgi:hypothetical protein
VDESGHHSAVVLNVHILPGGMNNRPVGGRSSETCSHPIDMMMMMIIIIMIIIFNALRVN